MIATLHIVGAPLNESESLSASAVQTLKNCELIIGESRPVLDRYLKPHGISAERFHLDPPRKDEQELLGEALQKMGKKGGNAALLSDVGLPLLFDPGVEILERCKKLGFRIKTTPGPTSWATACAVSGWNPPFLVQGFLDRDAQKRSLELKALKRSSAHIVFMETPYRFRRLLENALETFGPSQQAFLAWEIAKEEEFYFWGSLSEILRYAESKNLEKGEFVLLLKAPSSVK